MKYRQAKKIIRREAKKGIHGYGGCLLGPPWWMKAIIVFVHHKKKTDYHFYESRGILRELRWIYEKRRA